MLWILIAVLLVAAIVGAPGVVWPHEYGYGPSGIVTLIIVVLVLLLLTGRI